MSWPKGLGSKRECFPTDEAYCDYILEPSGMTFEEFKKVGGLSVPYSFRKYEAKGFNTPWTSSMGRLFDGVSSLLSIRDEVHYEGQAAIELEMVADQRVKEKYSFENL
jgi:hydrogenase maturation factor HypF (carbamoyltransferase family)